jgi:hypothetical protein
LASRCDHSSGVASENLCGAALVAQEAQDKSSKPVRVNFIFINDGWRLRETSKDWLDGEENFLSQSSSSSIFDFENEDEI